MQRKTGQREAIKKALEEADRPLSPQEILSGARAHCPKVGIATVYRAIKDLAEAAWLSTVEMPGESARYELSSKPHHHHFHCRKCNKVFEVNSCPGHFEELTPKGYVLEDHEVILRGLCPACVKV